MSGEHPRPELPRLRDTGEVVIRHRAKKIEASFCRHHADYYSRRPETFEIVALAPGLAVCPRCRRVIGNRARASHHSLETGTRCTEAEDVS